MGSEAQLHPSLLASCHLEGRAKQLGATPRVSITVSFVVTQTAHDTGRARPTHEAAAFSISFVCLCSQALLRRWQTWAVRFLANQTLSGKVSQVCFWRGNRQCTSCTKASCSRHVHPCPETFNGLQCHQDMQDNFQSQGPCEWLDYEMLAGEGDTGCRQLRAPTGPKGEGQRRGARPLPLGVTERCHPPSPAGRNQRVDIKPQPKETVSRKTGPGGQGEAHSITAPSRH